MQDMEPIGNRDVRIGVIGCGNHASTSIYPALRNAPVEQNRQVQVGFMMRFSPAHRMAKANIVGTPGRRLYGELQDVYEQNKDKPNVIWMDKTRYRAFAGTDLELVLRARNIAEVHFVGVCTDICVLYTAVDAYNKGFRIVVHKDAVASFNPAGHEWAPGHFASSIGADVV